MYYSRISSSGHTLITGRTGMGKSTLLARISSESIAAGAGLLLIDPHGDLAASALADMPRRRRNDLVQFSATEPTSCRGLSPLRHVPPERRALIVSNLLATLRKLWPDFWGPRTEHVLRHVLLALTEVRGATLVDARAMLVDETRRRWVLKQVTDEHVLFFWGREFPGYGKAFGAEVTAPILNKLGSLLASPAVREIVTRHRPTLDARAAMDRGRIVIASLPKGQIGEDAALLLGGILLGAFQHATMSRADVPPGERRPFSVIVDEIGSFVTGPFLELLAEARKYGVSIVMAAQSLAAMDQQVRRAMLANVGTLTAFRASADDVELLQREFAGRFRPDVLMGLDVGECVVKSGRELPRIVRLAA